MTDQEIEKIIAERDYYKKKFQEEEDYKAWVIKHRFKGYAGGNLTRCAGWFCTEHSVVEDAEKEKTMLRKLANNPALSEEAHKAMVKAVRYVTLCVEYRKLYFDLLDSSEKLRKLEGKKLVVRRKIENARKED